MINLYHDAKQVLRQLNQDLFAQKKILLTGSSGLLGTNIVNVFRHFDKNKLPEVFGTTLSSNNDIISSAINEQILTVIPWNLALDPVPSELTKHKFDIIIHAAGYGQPGRFLENKLNTIRVNTTATDTLFNLLKADGRFVFISTSEVYSGGNTFPSKEVDIGATNTDHTRASYIESKRCGETICNIYNDYGFSTICARLALAYGPGVRLSDKRVLNSFIQKALQNGEIELMDRGAAMRTYAYITDVIEVILKMCCSAKTGIYNLGGKSRISIADLAEKIGQMMKVPVRIPKVDSTMSEAPKDVMLDLRKMSEDFSKHSFIDLEVGLQKTIDWYKYLASMQKI